MSAVSVLTIAVGIVGLAMITGFFWGWAFSAMPGLRRVDDATYVTTMREINRAILNPMFLATFVATVVVLAVATVVTFLAGDTRRAWWVAAAAFTYTVGVFGLTAAGNVPLNNRLDAFDPTVSDDAGVTAARQAYEGPWNRLHAIRSALGVLAVVFATAAALTPTED